MKQSSKRRKAAPKPRARRDSARLFAGSSKQTVGGGDVKTRTVPASSARQAKTPPRPVPKVKASKNAEVQIDAEANANTKAGAGRKSARQSPRDSNLAGSSLLWTREPVKGTRQDMLFMRAVKAIGGFVLLLFGSIFRGIRAVFVAFGSMVARSKIALAIVVVFAVIIAAGLIDAGINWGKVYPKVMVGEIDLSGKTVEEAQKIIEDTYTPRLSSKTVYIFASEEASRDLEGSLAQTNDEAMAEQQSLEDVQDRKLVWETDAATLAATLDTKGMVAEALAYGRENGGLINRLQALFYGFTIEPRAHYGEDAFEALAADIDATIGNPRINYGISVLEGNAVVIEGHDGHMVDRGTFASELDKALLAEDTQAASFVAKAEYAPLQITWEMAQETCDQVNTAIALGARFVYQDAVWTVNAIDIGNWVQTRMEQQGGAWALVPYLDYGQAKGMILNHLKANFKDGDVRIRFTVENGQTLVHSKSEGTIPRSEDAVDQLNAIIFEGEEAHGSQPIIQVGAAAIPTTMGLQEALDNGIITCISDYTTEYTANVANRNHNIHLAADLLNKSIASADGGIWSFNETAGNCNEDAGFKGAGSIIDGEYVDEIGGGICQVATTVFNAVYDAGYPVVQRHNHSLYIASYPAGRDAAVSWPDLDLKWKNDTTSDILLLTSYTESTITVALYGISPEYTVSTDTGNWVEGEKYKTRTVTDDTLAPGYSYLKVYGTDGSSITIVRTVKDRYGTVLHEDTFVSNYDPKDEVKVEGPKQEPSGPGTAT